MSEIYDRQIIFITHSGGVIKYIEANEIEDQAPDQQQYFGLVLSPEFDVQQLVIERELSKSSNYFRHFQKLSMKYEDVYLFSKPNGKPISQIISESKMPFKQNSIDIYLIYLLEALYELHKISLLGRVFSTDNIFSDNDHHLILMDFGFGPKLVQESLYVLAPPEVIFDLLQSDVPKNVTYPEYDIKIDSWLIGAFLYHLMQRKKINEQYKYIQPDLIKYAEQIKQSQIKGQDHISISDNSYSQSLKNLVIGLLKFKKEDRFSFIDIYKSEYVQNLSQLIKDFQQKMKFYNNFQQSLENQEIMFKIKSRESLNQGFILDTKNLVPAQEIELQKLRLDDSSLFPPSISRTSKLLENQMQFDLYEEQLKNTDLIFIKQQNQQNLQIKRICDELNLELLRCHILCRTVYELQQISASLDVPHSSLIQYQLLKMSILLFQEMETNFTNNISQFNKFDKYEMNQLQQWINSKQIFKEINQKLTYKIKYHYQIQGEHYFMNHEIDQKVIDDIQNDLRQNFNFSQSSYQFLRSSYRIITQNLYKYLRNKILFLKSQKQEYKQLIHLLYKAVLCHAINHLISIENSDSLLRLIDIKLSNRSIAEELNEILENQDNYQIKKDQINQILKSYFP